MLPQVGQRCVGSGLQEAERIVKSCLPLVIRDTLSWFQVVRNSLMYLWYRCFRESAHKNSRPGLHTNTIVFFQDYTPHFNTCFLTAEKVTNCSTIQLSDVLKVFDQISLECQDIREVFDQSQLSLLKPDTCIEKKNNNNNQSVLHSCSRY